MGFSRVKILSVPPLQLDPRDNLIGQRKTTHCGPDSSVTLAINTRYLPPSRSFFFRCGWGWEPGEAHLPAEDSRSPGSPSPHTPLPASQSGPGRAVGSRELAACSGAGGHWPGSGDLGCQRAQGGRRPGGLRALQGLRGLGWRGLRGLGVVGARGVLGARGAPGAQGAPGTMWQLGPRSGTRSFWIVSCGRAALAMDGLHRLGPQGAHPALCASSTCTVCLQHLHHVSAAPALGVHPALCATSTCSGPQLAGRCSALGGEGQPSAF